MTDAAPVLPSPPKNPTIKSTPPEGSPLATTRALTWPEALQRIVADLSRRGLRFAVSMMIFKLQMTGKLDLSAALFLTACALGVESAILAWKERQLPLAAGMTLLPFVLAGLGQVAQQAALLDAAGYTAALLPLAGYFAKAPTV